MTASTFSQLEAYMCTCMEDNAHDREHIYRVLYTALDIADTEENVDYDVLICACLLHDIGRKEQAKNPTVCHAEVGAKQAYAYLLANGFGETFAEQVRSCISAHRFRKNNPPRNIEEKILYDADKLDAVGAMGIARTLLYQGKLSDPLYSLLPDGQVSDGQHDVSPSFFQEYHFKLKKLYGSFHTARGRQLAMERQQAAIDFYHALFREASSSRNAGQAKLTLHIQP